MDIAQQINEKTIQISQLSRELHDLFDLQVVELRTSLLGKYVIVTGEKGWNKGIVTEVRLHGMNYISLENTVLKTATVIKVEHCGQSRNVYDTSKVRLMTDDEIKAWQKSTSIDRLINERAAKIAKV